MDLIWGMGIGLLMGAVIGYTTCALMVVASRADDYAEMYRVIREREELDRVEVTE